jgi:hypothetical protein
MKLMLKFWIWFIVTWDSLRFFIILFADCKRKLPQVTIKHLQNVKISFIPYMKILTNDNVITAFQQSRTACFRSYVTAGVAWKRLMPSCSKDVNAEHKSKFYSPLPAMMTFSYEWYSKGGRKTIDNQLININCLKRYVNYC